MNRVIFDLLRGLMKIEARVSRRLIQAVLSAGLGSCCLAQTCLAQTKTSATPTLVQTVSCSNSNNPSGGSAEAGFGGPPPWDYYCQLAEPSQANNLIVVGVVIDDTDANNTI